MVKKVNTKTESHFKGLTSENVISAMSTQESGYTVCKTESSISPKKYRRASHKVESHHYALNESRFSKMNTDTQISKLMMMRKIANQDLKLIKEKKLSEKKSSSSTKSLKQLTSPFLLEEKSENKLIICNNEDREVDSKIQV
jgi:hypothetical protein